MKLMTITANFMKLAISWLLLTDFSVDGVARIPPPPVLGGYSVFPTKPSAQAKTTAVTTNNKYDMSTSSKSSQLSTTEASVSSTTKISASSNQHSTKPSLNAVSLTTKTSASSNQHSTKRSPSAVSSTTNKSTSSSQHSTKPSSNAVSLTTKMPLISNQHSTKPSPNSVLLTTKMSSSTVSLSPMISKTKSSTASSPNTSVPRTLKATSSSQKLIKSTNPNLASDSLSTTRVTNSVVPSTLKKTTVTTPPSTTKQLAATKLISSTTKLSSTVAMSVATLLSKATTISSNAGQTTNHLPSTIQSTTAKTTLQSASNMFETKSILQISNALLNTFETTQAHSNMIETSEAQADTIETSEAQPNTAMMLTVPPNIPETTIIQEVTSESAVKTSVVTPYWPTTGLLAMASNTAHGNGTTSFRNNTSNSLSKSNYTSFESGWTNLDIAAVLVFCLGIIVLTAVSAVVYAVYRQHRKTMGKVRPEDL